MYNIIHHEDKAYKIVHKLRYSLFTNKLGQFNNDVLVAYKKHYNIEYVLKADDNHLLFCTLIPEAQIIIDDENHLIQNH